EEGVKQPSSPQTIVKAVDCDRHLASRQAVEDQRRDDTVEYLPVERDRRDRRYVELGGEPFPRGPLSREADRVLRKITTAHEKAVPREKDRPPSDSASRIEHRLHVARLEELEAIGHVHRRRRRHPCPGNVLKYPVPDIAIFGVEVREHSSFKANSHCAVN